MLVNNSPHSWNARTDLCKSFVKFVRMLSGMIFFKWMQWLNVEWDDLCFWMFYWLYMRVFYKWFIEGFSVCETGYVELNVTFNLRVLRTIYTWASSVGVSWMRSNAWKSCQGNISGLFLHLETILFYYWLLVWSF